MSIQLLRQQLRSTRPLRMAPIATASRAPLVKGNGITTVRMLSSRATAIFEALELPTGETLPGVYDGAWGGTGEIIESKCPATGEVIGRVQTVSERIS